jgi:undecaprenyl-diphosphatase
MWTAIIQFNHRLKNKFLRKYIIALIISFIAFMILARLVSGVHWVTDIIGGILLSAGLVMLYLSITKIIE